MADVCKASHGVLLDTDRTEKDGDEDERRSGSEETSPQNDDEGGSSQDSASNSKSESSRTGTTVDDANNLKDELARHETINVFRLRVVVIIILVTLAAAVCYLIYDITHEAEIVAFETEFEGNAEMIIASLNGK